MSKHCGVCRAGAVTGHPLQACTGEGLNGQPGWPGCDGPPRKSRTGPGSLWPQCMGTTRSLSPRVQARPPQRLPCFLLPSMSEAQPLLPPQHQRHRGQEHSPVRQICRPNRVAPAQRWSHPPEDSGLSGTVALASQQLHPAKDSRENKAPFPGLVLGRKSPFLDATVTCCHWGLLCAQGPSTGRLGLDNRYILQSQALQTPLIATCPPQGLGTVHCSGVLQGHC